MRDDPYGAAPEEQLRILLGRKGKRQEILALLTICFLKLWNQAIGAVLALY